VGVDTPEFAKMLFLVILAVVVARHARKFHRVEIRAHVADAFRDWRGGAGLGGVLWSLWRDLRPIAYRSGCSDRRGTSAVRRDFGTLIPTFPPPPPSPGASPAPRRTGRPPTAAGSPGPSRDPRGVGATLFLGPVSA